MPFPTLSINLSPRMIGLRSLKEKIFSRIRSSFFHLSIKWEAGKIRLQKRLDPYVTAESHSDNFRNLNGKESATTEDWSENLPPFSFTETETQEIFPNAKRKFHRVRKHKVSLWSLLFFLPWKSKIPESASSFRAFHPGENLFQEEPKKKVRKKENFHLRNKPYFWEVWFPQISTLTLSPFVIWETSVPADLFQDCLPESVLPIGEPGKWKVRIQSMRVLSHQLGNLYEDSFPSPNRVYRTEVWVYGHTKEEEIDPERPLLFPLGVWISPDLLKEEEPRLRQGLPFRTGETYWKIQGENLKIGIRGLEWTWKPARENSHFESILESPHVFLGKSYFTLESESFTRDRQIAYLFKRAITSDPKVLQRSRPRRNLSSVSPNPNRI
ncbi:hypothetical protein EHQ52_00945 [Leptospira koniambonensis]|uniref:Uncharacterized protein n=1 Tax=Leptospira koniambonensis TaxID=2484950 RepID=A0A4R9JDB0_9LEPT|nr:hypothetical protein [Leptospira koniambonensis]TGL36475.1 hypothetical protein EHQ52_00945 [Leptospira koniambonensis]